MLNDSDSSSNLHTFLRLRREMVRKSEHWPSYTERVLFPEEAMESVGAMCSCLMGLFSYICTGESRSLSSAARPPSDQSCVIKICRRTRRSLLQRAHKCL